MIGQPLAAHSHVALVNSFPIGRIEVNDSKKDLEEVGRDKVERQHAHSEAQCFAH
jgi:hypothetical protein